MHTLSRKDLSTAELETLQRSRNPSTVITANGEVRTNEEVTGYVRDLELFVMVQILEDTPAVLSSKKASSAKNTVIPTSGPVGKNHS